MIDLRERLASNESDVALGAAEAIRDGCRPADLALVLERLDAPPPVEGELLLTLVEACSSIGDPAALPALWRVLDRVADKEAREIVSEGIAAFELGVTHTDGGEHLYAMAKDRRFGANAADLRKAAVKLNPKLKWKKAPRPPTREALEAALSEWAFAMDEEKGIPAELAPQYAKWLLDDAARNVGLRTPEDWQVASEYFEAENFHGLVEWALQRSRGLV